MFMKICLDSQLVEYLDLPLSSPDFFHSCCGILNCDSPQYVSTIIPGIGLILDGEKFINHTDEVFINNLATFLYPGSNLIYGDVLVTGLKDGLISPLSNCDMYVVNNYLNSYCPF